MFKKSVLTLAVVTGLAGTATAATTILDTTQDNMVRLNNVNGTDDRLLVGNNANFGGPLRGLLVFDLSSIAATDTITSVSLELTVTSVNGNDLPFLRTFELTEVPAFDSDPTWSEIDGSPTLNEEFGSVLASEGVASTDSTTTFASTAGFESYVAGAFGGNVYFAIQDSAETQAAGTGNQAFVRYDAIGDGGTVAKLTVNHIPVPEPGSLALLAAGGLWVLRRRRG